MMKRIVPPCTRLIVSHIFSAGHRGYGESHGERVFSPRGAQDGSPGQGSKATAALGNLALQIALSPASLE